jgi:hypothetical protein
MRTARWWVGSALAVWSVATLAGTGSGLSVHADLANDWPRWQGRMLVDSVAPPWRTDLSAHRTAGLKIEGLGLLGDYYFASMPLGSSGAGGFRATSGVLFGSGRSALRALPPGGEAASHLSRQDQRRLAGATDNGDAAAQLDTVPYVGVGYSGLTGRSGWGFAADIGVMAIGDGSGLRPRGLDTGQNVDDLLRDLRMAPVIQLGVSYSF